MRRQKVYSNWIKGRYAEEIFLHHREMYPSYLHLDRYNLYISRKSEIVSYERHPDEAIVVHKQPKLVVSTKSSADVMCFKRKNNVIFGGRDNGNMFLIENGEMTEERTSTDLLGNSPVIANDFAENVFVTATKNELRIWQRYMELGRSVLEPVAEFDDFYKSTCFSSSGRQLACGKFRDPDRGALEMIDVET